jgi:hypothetical protein
VDVYERETAEVVKLFLASKITFPAFEQMWNCGLFADPTSMPDNHHYRKLSTRHLRAEIAFTIYFDGFPTDRPRDN